MNINHIILVILRIESEFLIISDFFPRSCLTSNLCKECLSTIFLLFYFCIISTSFFHRSFQEFFFFKISAHLVIAYLKAVNIIYNPTVQAH